MSGKIPSRAWRCVATAHGDTPEDMAHILRELAQALEEGAPESTIGGVTGGGHVETVHDKSMTPERYRRELEEWREREKGGR